MRKDCLVLGDEQMLTILRALLRYRGTFPRAVHISPKLITALISLLVTAAFMCAGGDHALAEKAQSNAVAMSSNVAVQTGSGAVTSEPGEHGPSQKAVEIARPFGFPITNSMVASWIVAVGLIVFAQVATRHMKLLPDG